MLHFRKRKLGIIICHARALNYTCRISTKANLNFASGFVFSEKKTKKNKIQYMRVVLLHEFICFLVRTSMYVADLGVAYV
jgi:hypothetical protein